LNGHAVYVYDSEGTPIFKWSECIQFWGLTFDKV
jgi:hypothetical protein